MKAFKILITLLFITATVFVSSSGIPAEQATVSPRNLLTLHTVTSLGFIDGYARVNVDYIGYDENAEICIDVVIEKQVLYFFKKEIFSKRYSSKGDRYQNEFFYPLETDGVYTCTVVYTITCDGNEDVITFTDTRNYRLSDHPTHTHVWIQERIEPNCKREGVCITSCYCGAKKEIIFLEKLPHTEGEPVITTISDTEYLEKIYCKDCGELLVNTSVTVRPPEGVTVVQPNSVQISTSSSITSNQDCTCPFCKLADSIPQVTPPMPKQPSIPTNDPWRKQQEQYQKRNNINPYHINKSQQIRIFP